MDKYDFYLLPYKYLFRFILHLNSFNINLYIILNVLNECMRQHHKRLKENCNTHILLRRKLFLREYLTGFLILLLFFFVENMKII